MDDIKTNNKDNKQKEPVLRAVLIIAVVVLLFAFAIYKGYNSNELQGPVLLTIKNDSKTKFKAVGIMWDNHIILEKTNTDSFAITDDVLAESLNTNISIVALKDNGELIKSGQFHIEYDKGSPVIIRAIKNGELDLNIVTEKRKMKEIKFPKKYTWKMEQVQSNTQKYNIEGSFAGQTKNNYVFYVQGRGGVISQSDECKDNQTALAAWEAPGDIKSSWVHMFKGNMSSDDNDDRDDVGGNDNIKVEDE